ncbi:hypothetical protein [Jannaschia sp. M317]|nr:hypothetical protein [Jannaschia sp. M317]UWQ17786.1 hypothetical protein K3551_00245 [Jannaschia sp. M317]
MKRAPVLAMLAAIAAILFASLDVPAPKAGMTPVEGIRAVQRTSSGPVSL